MLAVSILCNGCVQVMSITDSYAPPLGRLPSIISGDAGRVIKEGYISKLGGAKGGFPTWKERWMILKGESLYYYKSREVLFLVCYCPCLQCDVSCFFLFLLSALKFRNGPQEMVLLGVVPLTPDAQVVQPPAWMDADVCYECKTEFGVFKRKHHCRYGE
jgi:hypothetical protein